MDTGFFLKYCCCRRTEQAFLFLAFISLYGMIFYEERGSLFAADDTSTILGISGFSIPMTEVLLWLITFGFNTIQMIISITMSLFHISHKLCHIYFRLLGDDC